MGARFYDLKGQVQSTIPKKDGTGLRSAHMGDAKKHGWVASVTTICGLLNEGDGLMNWKIDQYLSAAEGLGEALQRGHLDNWKAAVKHKAEEKMKAAPQLGSDVHAAVEEYLKYLVNPEYDPKRPSADIRPYMAAVRIFIEEHRIRPLGENPIEQVIVNADARTAGRLDFRGTIDGKGPVYFDWKTQKVRGNPNFYFKFPLQLSAYWYGDGAATAGSLLSVVIDTSRHGTYNTTNNLPHIYIQRYNNPAVYYEYFKMLSTLYYAQNDWEPSACKV